MAKDKPRPGIYPRERPRVTSSAAEIAVYEALRAQLPKGWYCWHSLAVFTDDWEEAEGDFVIAVPSRGMLVLEVKGGKIELRDGRWLQNGKAMKRRPLDQAHRSAELIRARFEEARLFYPPFGHAVVFPDTAFGADGGPDDVRGRVLHQYDLLALGDALPLLVERCVPAQKVRGAAWIEKLHELWGESWIPDSGLGSEAALDEENRIRLDHQQLELVDNLFDNPRVVVSGGAGTGKTIIAREAARRFANGGKKVLFLCFTDALAMWLRSQIGSEAIAVDTVRRFARVLLARAGANIPSEAQQDRDFWEAVVHRALDEATAEILENPFEAVIVDEGQDLTAEDWQLVEALVRDRGRMWVFYDPAQAFWADRAIPEKLLAGARYTLKRAYRCHPSIQAFADLYAGRDDGEPSARDGIATGRIRLVQSSVAIRATVAQEVDLLLKEGFERSQIAVVSVVGQGRAGVVSAKTIGTHKVVRADDAAMKREVVCDTFLRIKGLERPAVIVTDLSLIPGTDAARRNVRMHIALTRAQSALRIVAERDSFERDPILKRFV